MLKRVVVPEDSNPFREARIQSVMTQAEMGERMGGLDVAVVSKLERNPKGQKLERLIQFAENVSDEGRESIREYVGSMFVK